MGEPGVGGSHGASIRHLAGSLRAFRAPSRVAGNFPASIAHALTTARGSSIRSRDASNPRPDLDRRDVRARLPPERSPTRRFRLAPTFLGRGRQAPAVRRGRPGGVVRHHDGRGPARDRARHILVMYKGSAHAPETIGRTKADASARAKQACSGCGPASRSRRWSRSTPTSPARRSEGALWDASIARAWSRASRTPPSPQAR